MADKKADVLDSLFPGKTFYLISARQLIDPVLLNQGKKRLTRHD